MQIVWNFMQFIQFIELRTIRKQNVFASKSKSFANKELFINLIIYLDTFLQEKLKEKDLKISTYTFKVIN